MADIEVVASGTMVTAGRPDRIVIRLAENAVTGYQWSVAEVGDALGIESDELVPPGQAAAPGAAGQAAAPGAAGQRVIVIRPRGPGRARVRLLLKRAWEPEPIDRFDLDVAVDDR